MDQSKLLIFFCVTDSVVPKSMCLNARKYKHAKLTGFPKKHSITAPNALCNSSEYTASNRVIIEKDYFLNE